MKEQKGITLIALIITIIVMLILAGVSISLTVGEDGVINKANQAVEKTIIAQIRERADLVKASLNLDIETEEDKNIIVTQEFAERLAKELDGRIEGNKVIVNGDEYAVTLKGIDLEIDISEYNGVTIDESTVLSQTCEITDDNKLKINISRMGQSALVTELQKESGEKVKNMSSAEREKIMVDYFITQSDVFKGATTIDRAVMQALESMVPGTSYSTLEGWLTDQNVIGLATQLGITDLKVDHLYSYVLFESKDGITKETLLSDDYVKVILTSKKEALLELSKKANKKLSIVIEKDGETTNITTPEGGNYTASIDLNTTGTGTYTIHIKTYQSDPQDPPPYTFEFATEKVVVNKLK